jgi:hypothetical protein
MMLLFGYAYPLVHVLGDYSVSVCDLWRVYFNNISVTTAFHVRIPPAGSIGHVVRDADPQCGFARPGLCPP